RSRGDARSVLPTAAADAGSLKQNRRRQPLLCHYIRRGGRLRKGGKGGLRAAAGGRGRARAPDIPSRRQAHAAFRLAACRRCLCAHKPPPLCCSTRCGRGNTAVDQQGRGVVSDDFILHTENLTKEFAGFVAVNGVSLKVTRGTIHALIGPNGAGKTTCFNLLTKF